MKTCTNCLISFTETEFYTVRSTRCKSCTKDIHKADYQAAKARDEAVEAAWYLERHEQKRVAERATGDRLAKVIAEKERVAPLSYAGLVSDFMFRKPKKVIRLFS